ncbi:MAG: PqqD family protein [Chloroflexi bacterium]|nr:PqqD family protein [Chloroflexota bacterium]
MQSTFVPSQTEGFQFETVDGEIILLHPTRNIIIHGNQMGALVWQLCDGMRTVDEIIEILSAAYPEAGDEIQAEVPIVIQTLVSRGALETK